VSTSEPIPPPSARPYAGETYYSLPGLKPGHYGWLVVGYLWVGGLTGAAAVLAAVADLAGSAADRDVARIGRYLALAGALISPILLTLDLYTPERFFNMLRIFRRASAMSIGVYILTGFGVFAGLAAAAQLAVDLGAGTWAIWVGRVAGIPAAIAGMGMACYTATLLAASSPPMWAAVPRLLPALFAASSASLGAAAIVLVGKFSGMADATAKRLELIDLIAVVLELGLLIATHLRWRHRRVDGPLYAPAMTLAYFGGAAVVGMLFPIVGHVVAFIVGSSPTLSVAIAFAGLAGGFALRAVVLFAGKKTAEDPQTYFQFAQPENLPNAQRG
jgi:protein NrfD